MLCTYTGTDSRMYLDYRDTLTGRGLEVSPGGTYDIEAISGPAGGLLLPPGDGRWMVAVARKGVFEVPAPPARKAASPVLAAEPAAPASTEAAEPAEEEN